MGHIHLPQLPRTRAWSDVVALLDGGATDDAVISMAATAAEKELREATNDPVFVEAVRLLAAVPHAARSADFGLALKGLGLAVPKEPVFLDLLIAIGQGLDQQAVHHGRSDFGELARRSLAGALSVELGDRARTLFGSDHRDLQIQAARLSRPPEFARLARRFFGQLTGRALASWLDRVLSTRIGPEARFGDVTDRTAFDQALAQYCAEATRIIREFAAGWYAKTLWRDGEVTAKHAAAFGHVAMKKIGEELRRKYDG